jgi:two-component system, LytTR family, sensor kinase
MYLFFIGLTFCLRNFMYFVINKQTVAYHITVSIISLTETLIIWEFLLLIGKILEKRLPILRFTYGRIILQILLTYGLSFLTGTLFFYIIDYLFKVTYPPQMEAIIHLLYFMLIVVINLIYVGTIYIFNWKNDLIKLANVERGQALVQYDALKNQMNPHFLFNALTSVNSLIHSNPDLATEFLQQLSKVYRYVLQNKEKETVSVSTELAFIANYTGLLKTRFAEAIEFRIDLSEDAKKMEIVPVTLQILIENAIKHNIVSAAHPLKISITNNDSFLLIQNNINKKGHVETSNNQGMGNLKSLYQYLASKPIEIMESETLYMVKIPLIGAT